MTTADVLKSVRFVVDQEGQVTAAILDMQTWQAFLDLVEEHEDQAIVRDRLTNWGSKQGWSKWEDVAAELQGDDDAVPTLDRG